MTIAVISHDVDNFAAWKKFYDADSARRDKAGFRELIVGTRSDNPNKAYIIGIIDPISLDKLMNDPELKEKMKEAGVRGVPEIFYINT
jgi:hypothetical protein